MKCHATKLAADAECRNNFMPTLLDTKWGDQWNSRLDHFIPVERVPVTFWIKEWIYHSFVVEAERKTTVPSFRWKSHSDFASIQLVARSVPMRYPWFLSFKLPANLSRFLGGFTNSPLIILHLFSWKRYMGSSYSKYCHIHWPPLQCSVQSS